MDSPNPLEINQNRQDKVQKHDEPINHQLLKVQNDHESATRPNNVNIEKSISKSIVSESNPNITPLLKIDSRNKTGFEKFKSFKNFLASEIVTNYIPLDLKDEFWNVIAIIMTSIRRIIEKLRYKLPYTAFLGCRINKNNLTNVLVILVIVLIFIVREQSIILRQNENDDGSLNFDRTIRSLRQKNYRVSLRDQNGSAELINNNNKLTDDKKISTQPIKLFANISYHRFPQLGNSNRKPLTSKPEFNHQQYLLPILHFQEGPNNLFRMFKETALIAYKNNQSITFPIFHTHPRMTDDFKNADDTLKLPVFESWHIVNLLRNAEDTFHADYLGEKMGILDSQTYDENCLGNIEILIRCGHLDNKQKVGISHYLRAAKLTVSREIDVKDTADYAQKLKSGGIPKNYKCLALVLGKYCLAESGNQWLEDYHEITNYIQRPKILTTLAKEYIRIHFKNKPYLAIHFRFDDDWLDMCRYVRGPLSQIQNLASCELYFSVIYSVIEQRKFIQKIRNVMEEYDLQYVYLATTPNNIDLITLVREELKEKIHMQDQVFKFIDETLYPGYLNNNYLRSFVEQELCYQSTYFLGSGLSSWTQTILQERFSDFNYNYDSIPRKLGAEKPTPPGYTPLIFQFPEGDFIFDFPKDPDTGLYFTPEKATAGKTETQEALRSRYRLKAISKIQDITFLKMPGTSFDIIDNILMRFGVKNHLRVATSSTPKKDDPINVPFKLEFLQKPFDLTSTKPINIVSDFINVSNDLYKIINPSTRFITLIRHPINQMRLSFEKEKLELLPLSEIIQDQPDLFKNSENVDQRLQAFFGSSYENSYAHQQFDRFSPFAFRVSNPVTTIFKREILLDADPNNVDFHFEVVLLEEYLDESLLILAEHLAWDLDDLVYLKQNYGLSDHGNIDKVPDETTELAESIIKYNQKDMNFYNFHKAKLLNHMQEDFQFSKKLENFKKKVSNLEKTCKIVEDSKSDDDRYKTDRERFIEAEIKRLRRKRDSFEVLGPKSEVEQMNSDLRGLCQNFCVIEQIYDQDNNNDNIEFINAEPDHDYINNKIFLPQKISKFLTTGHWNSPKMDEFIPGNCNSNPLPTPNFNQITSKILSKSKPNSNQYNFIMIGDPRTTNILSPVFREILKIPHETYYANNYAEYLMADHAWFRERIVKADYILIGEQFLWHHWENNFEFDIQIRSLAKILDLLMPYSKLIYPSNTNKPSKKILVMAPEPVPWSEFDAPLKIFDEKLKQLLLNYSDNYIYYMKNGRNSRYDINQQMIPNYDQYYKVHLPDEDLVKFEQLPANLRSDIKIILSYFFSETVDDFCR